MNQSYPKLRRYTEKGKEPIIPASAEHRVKIGRVVVKTPANVAVMGGASRLDIPVSRVLASALDANLRFVVLTGVSADGTAYHASSLAGGPEALWAIEAFKSALLRVGGV